MRISLSSFIGLLTYSTFFFLAILIFVFSVGSNLERLNDFYLDMEPSAPYMVFTSHTDQPGMIGKVGMIAGEYDANISFMEVGREAPRGEATMIVGFDDPVTEQMVSAISSVAGVSSVKLVQQPSLEPTQPRLRGT